MTKVTKMENIIGRPFNFRMPREVIFEAGISSLAAQKAAALGAKRPVFITGRSIAKSGALARLMDGARKLGMKPELWPEVEPEPPVALLYKAAADIRTLGGDCLVALGGGSSMDFAKMAAVLAKFPELDASAMVGSEKVPARGLPTIMIPTTACSGSEVSAVAVFSFPEENLHLSVAEAASRELLHERVLERLLLRRGDVFEPAVLVVIRLLAHVRGVLLVEAREPFELFEAFGLGRLRRGLAALVELEQRIFGVKLFKTLRKLAARHLQHLERLYHFVGKRLRLFLFQLKHGGPPLRGDLPKSCAGLAVSAFHQTKAKAGKSQAGRPAYVFRRRSARLGNFCARRRV